MNGLRVSDFDYDLPAELIAQQPPAERGQSRMLVMNRSTGAVRDATFAEFPSLLNPGDLLVLNDTRVIPARLYARRTLLRDHEKPSGQIEVMLTEPALAQTRVPQVPRIWGPGKHGCPIHSAFFSGMGGKPKLVQHPARTSGAPSSVRAEKSPSERSSFSPTPQATSRLKPKSSSAASSASACSASSQWTISSPSSTASATFLCRLTSIATMKRQTVNATRPSSPTNAARWPRPPPACTSPRKSSTALTTRGVEIARLTLHVGLGTFAPLRVERVDDVRLHRERYTLSGSAAEAINAAARSARRIVAVGTTVVRTLEHCALAAQGRQLEPHSGETEIFISPGFQFRLVSALLTNFHLPQSSLLMLVSAFAGREPVLAAYSHAVQQSYRFFSYGDCMFLS